MAAKFEKILISPDFPINFRKIHQVSKNYLKCSKSYGQKPLQGSLKTPPGLNRVKSKIPKKYWLESVETLFASQR